MLHPSSPFRLFRLPTRSIAIGALTLLASACTVTLETIPHDVTRTEATVGDGIVSDTNGDSVAADGSDGDGGLASDVVDTSPLDVTSDANDASDASDVADASDAIDDDVLDDVPDVEVCTPEMCNGVDDDCDGVVDNNIAAQTCGVGSCARVVPGCMDGVVPACAAASPSPEVCNGLDDDCDGMVDDLPPPPPCGLGACSTRVGTSCGGVGVGCAAAVGADTCGNGIDDNCNGSVDEGCNCAAYVLAGAPSTNTGLTQTSPLPTIAGAIAALGRTGTRGNVCVGALASGSVCSTMTTYNESFSMVEGISVYGGYNGSTWTRNPTVCPTIIQNIAPSGVFFGHTLTRATQIDGFIIRATANSTLGASNTAITIQEGGVIANNTIQAGGGAPACAIIATAPGPVADTPLIANNIIFAPDSSTPPALGRAIAVNNIAVEIRGNTIDAPRAVSESIGIELRNAHGSIIADNAAIRSLAAPRSIAIFASGATGNIVIARNTLVRSGLASGTSPGGLTGSIGIYMSGCTEPGPRIVDNSVISALTPASGSSFMNTYETNGIRVESCATTIETNGAITAAATTTVASGSGAFGIRCTGVGANCFVAGNGSISGLPSTGGPSQRALGISIDNGAYGRIDHNRLVVGSVVPGVLASYGIYMDSADDETLVEGNTVEPSTGAMYARGIFGANTRARIWNNFVHADGTDGIVIGTYGHARSPSAHSNTVVSTSGATRTNLLATDNDGGAGTAPAGTFSNNVAVCLGTGTATSAFFSTGARPAVFTNNDLFGCTSLYRETTVINLTDIAMINALSAAGSMFGGNVSGDPMITSGTNGHITAGSAAHDTGTAIAAPPRDVDGNPRPQGAGYDIGYDEAPLP